MKEPTATDELEAVLLKGLRAETTDEERRWLDETLASSEEHRRRAARFLANEALLVEAYGVERRAAAFAEALSPNERPQPTAAPQTLSRRIASSINGHGLLVALSACVLLGVLVYKNWILSTKLDDLHQLAVVQGTEPSVSEGVAGAPAPDSVEQPIVGRISGLREVSLEQGESELLFGSQVRQGQSIRLAGGLVELLLSTGAKVTIQGPAAFELTSPSEATFQHGRLAAAVPRLARGYTIMTPTSEVVDIGTQFGVLVEDSGDTEVHVFDGHVVARSLADENGQLLHARQDEAMRFDRQSGPPKRMAAATGDFVRRIGPNVDDLPFKPLPVAEGLSLWLSAGAIVDAKPTEPINVWRDLLIGDNIYADDAWQFDTRRAPQYVIDVNDQPALRFDGWSTYLATSPMAPLDSRTVFVVCSPGPVSFADRTRGGMLLKHVGAPSLELTVFEDRTAQGWVWPGPDSEQNDGIVHGRSPLGSAVSVLSYQYDSDQDHAELWLNGQSEGVASAPPHSWRVGRRYIGSHNSDSINAFFMGNIYEVVVYDHSLSDQQRQQIDRYFAERYEIGADAPL